MGQGRECAAQSLRLFRVRCVGFPSSRTRGRNEGIGLPFRGLRGACAAGRPGLGVGVRQGWEWWCISPELGQGFGPGWSLGYRVRAHFRSVNGPLSSLRVESAPQPELGAGVGGLELHLRLESEKRVVLFFVFF